MDKTSGLPTLRQKIFLIGDVDTQIHGNKLPSKLQILKVLFFNIRQLKLSLRDAAILVAKEVMIFWDKAHLPTRTLYQSADMVKDLYQQWRNLQKNKGKLHNVPKEKEFMSELENLFDISSRDILQKIDQHQKDFISDQRKPGRVGSIANIESIYNIHERAQREREEILMKRLQKSEGAKGLSNQSVELESSDGGSSQNLSQRSVGTYSNILVEDLQNVLPNVDSSEAGPSAPKKSRGTVNVIDEKVAAVLDNCQVTDSNGKNFVKLKQRTLKKGSKIKS